MGQLFGSYYWEGNTLRLYYTCNGKRMRPKFATMRTGSRVEKQNLEKEARRKLNEIELSISAGLFESSGNDYPTYRQMACWYWEKHQMTKKYIQKDPRCAASDYSKLEYGIAFFGDTRADKINRECVKNFRMKLREIGNSDAVKRKWSEAYINRIVAAVGQVYNQCIKQEVWRFESSSEEERARYGNIDKCVNLENPLLGLPRLRETPTKPVVPTHDQFRKLLNCLNAPFRDMAIVGVHTGLRRRNVVQLKILEVDLKVGEIRIESHKGGLNSTTKRLHPEAIGVITRRISEIKKAGIKTEYVFCKNDGNHYLDFYTHWRKACSDAGIKGFWFEHLRPTYASWRVEEGVAMPLLQRSLDHATSQTTSRHYNQTSQATAEILKTQRPVLEPVGVGESSGVNFADFWRNSGISLAKEGLLSSFNVNYGNLN